MSHYIHLLLYSHLPSDPGVVDVLRKVLSDWLCAPGVWCIKCEEMLTGGDGDVEWKDAELPKDPGMFTGAELCIRLPPAIRENKLTLTMQH